ncbi:MAG: DUF3426 domain-containing protein [Betaproteobacteria bacterium]|nr:DUF3426 domain-containing protein [Betaproteobacteria bacterium]
MATERFTRCPHCASVYRVQSAQLQQAQGWLRCAQCHQPFDATAGVVVCNTLDTQMPVTASERIDLRSLLQVEDTPVGEGRPASPDVPGAPALNEALVSFEQALASFPVPKPGAAQDVVPDENTAHAQTRTTRRVLKPWVLLLVLALLVQTIWATRAQWAVHWPIWGQWAQSACDRLGCAWWPWREPRVLSLEHAHLSRADGAYRLQWVLHNQAAWPVSLPALELTLLDRYEQVLLRRVLLPTDLQAAPSVLAPQALWSAELRWQLPGDLQVSAYRMGVFYP